MLLVFNCSFWSAIAVNHLVLCTTDVKKIEKMEFDHILLFTATATYFPPTFEERHSKTVHQTEFSVQSPFRASDFNWAFMSSQHSCLSGNPQINKNCYH